ncbi:MAG: twin-arginine translocase TatA/TatE family subunit, partial [Candidatus Dormibacteraceae bacterium]
MPFGIHPVFLIILLAIVLIIFGPGKLPELGGAVGRSMKEFRKASSDLGDQVRDAIHDHPGAS